MSGDQRASNSIAKQGGFFFKMHFSRIAYLLACLHYSGRLRCWLAQAL